MVGVADHTLCKSDPVTPIVLCWQPSTGVLSLSKCPSLHQGAKGPHSPLSLAHSIPAILASMLFLSCTRLTPASEPCTYYFLGLEGSTSHPTPHPIYPWPFFPQPLGKDSFTYFKSLFKYHLLSESFSDHDPFKTPIPALLPSLLTRYVFAMDWIICPTDSYVKTLTPCIWRQSLWGWLNLNKVMRVWPSWWDYCP